MNKQHLYPLFLGPYGENNDILEKMLVEFLRDHVYWRRNFHPEDPQVIPTLAMNLPEYRDTVARMSRELHQLSAALKRSVPFSSPRYIGHMTSELLLPALVAQFMTLPYNPNNVVDEAAPVTLDMEISAGLQLARMLGFETDESSPRCAFGHLTSGGTVANYEALNVQRALRHYPLAVGAALRAKSLSLRVADEDVDCMDDWRLANFDTNEVLALHAAVLSLAEQLSPGGGRAFLDAVQAERIESLGFAEFARRHPEWREPVLLVPVTAHYSWLKGAKLIGLGAAQVRVVPEAGMRLDADALDAILAGLHTTRTPVLALVGVLGTTEFGTIDPIHRMLDVGNRWRKKGLEVPVHVDGAWGGYLASLFRNNDGSFVDYAAISDEFRYFPSREVHSAFRALARVDSVTVDPHKLGFVPFGAGAIVFRDQRMLDLVSLNADYVFDPERSAPNYRDKFRQLGRYILEGSKSGAAAAGVYVSQRVVPPDRSGLGRILAETIRATEYFHDRIGQLAESLRPDVTAVIPFEPDTNLVCIALNPAGNRRIEQANRFTRRVFSQMKVDAAQPVQTREFFGSYTTVSRRGLGKDEFARLLDRLGLDNDPEQETLFILRHTLMNPWLIDDTNDINYLDRYCDFLVRVARAALQETA